MHTTGWLLVAGLPVITGIALLTLEADPGSWVALTRPARWRVAADVLVVNAALVVIAAPLCGIAAASRSRPDREPAGARDAWRIARQLGALVGVFVAASAVVTTAGFGTTPLALELVAASHATLGAAALALAALGALGARLFRDPLDAVAGSAALALAASFGILLAGPLVQDLSYGLTNAALLASPMAAIPAAAQIDILRTDLLYQISPLAHRRFDYPLWYHASGLYLAVAVLCFAGATRFARTPDAPLTERTTRA